MPEQLFPHSRLVPYRDLEFELVSEGIARRTVLLDHLRDEVLEIAAVSRGWEDPAKLAFFRRYFKIEPLYEATGLVLVRKAGRLVGLAGSTFDWHVEAGSIVHLCSLGFLPEIQGRGFLHVFLSLLWHFILSDETRRRAYHQRRLYTTAITQSPYILWLMQHLADVYPSPYRATPTPEEIEVARRVVERFDPHLELEEPGLILRNECAFRYRRIPYGLDRAINRFCDTRLRYDQGDVFALVGQVDPDRVDPFLHRVLKHHPDLARRLHEALGLPTDVHTAPAGAYRESLLEKTHCAPDSSSNLDGP